MIVYFYIFYSFVSKDFSQPGRSIVYGGLIGIIRCFYGTIDELFVGVELDIIKFYFDFGISKIRHLNESFTYVPRLAEGFKYVGASGKALGVPMETVYAMLGKMNDNGLLGSTAGTGFNQMLKV